MKLETKIDLGVGCAAVVALSTIFVELKEIKKYQSAGSNVLTFAIIGAVLVFVLSVFTIILVNRNFRKHTQNLQFYTGKISKGETGFHVEAPCNDEFSKVYESLEKIVDGNKEFAEIANKIADGDLTVSIKERSDDDLLGHSLASLINNNCSVLSSISESSNQLTMGARQVAAASQSLAQGSTQQAMAIEEVTDSMQEIMVKTKVNAQNAKNASEIVISTKEAVSLGSERMSQMKVAMNDINESSEKISKIIKVIDDISFQTNILALNAAVEAARAGSHGKGFAVVAEQIRELAGKSADAAAETAEMIDDSIQKVHKGNKLAEDTANSLAAIVNDIDRVVEITGEINNSSAEQERTISQIDTAITQVSDVIQSNSASSEECAAAAEELSGQSYSLKSTVERYKLDTTKRGSVKYFDNDKNKIKKDIIKKSEIKKSKIQKTETKSDGFVSADSKQLSSESDTVVKEEKEKNVNIKPSKEADIKIELPDDLFNDEGDFGKY